jgi:sec-independent protein translocase protein TatC
MRCRFLDHLEDLRWLLIQKHPYNFMAIVTYFISDYLFDTIIFGPTRTYFYHLYFFCDLSNYIGIGDSICITEMPFIIQNTQMEGQVNVFIWICMLAGFILSFPYILWEIWKFIGPALYEKEKKNTKFLSFLFYFVLSWCLIRLFSYPNVG